MRFFIVLVFLSVVIFGAGCTTSRVIEDTRTPEITINTFGDVMFHGKHIAPEKIASAVKSAGIPKTQKIRILVPSEPDRHLMGRVAGYLHVAGYSTLFVTDRKVSIDIPTSSN
jgi:hypothetical protein